MHTQSLHTAHTKFKYCTHKVYTLHKV